MKTNVVHVEPLDVQRRLAQLGLTETFLVEAIRLAHLHLARLTANHPRNYAGFVMYGEGIAALRDLLRPEGWHRPESGVYELVINPSDTVAIAIASGDEGTGQTGAQPSNKSPKGRCTIRAIEANRQADMFAELLPKASPGSSSDLETWLLLHHFDPKRRERRIELSRPFDIDADGKITEWSERIILTPLSFDGDDGDIVLPDTPDIDFEIRRKAS